jgi:pyruvate formate lyase activating enzyme
MKGLIFSVKKYSVHDGPGIRITFFMKGCPLNCLWCHNPEGIDPGKQEIVQKRRIGDREFERTEEAGKYYEVEEIMELVRKEEVFIRQSGGGVTFSGGEPMMQSGFLLEALKACKNEEYHTAVDTSGYSSATNFAVVIPYTDLFLFDIKHLDQSRHIAITGVSNNEIIANYLMLLKSCREMFVRLPVVPGYNDDDEHLLKLRDFLSGTKSNSLTKICLLPFHRTGASKYQKLNQEFRMEGTEQPSAERMKSLKKFFEETGIKVKIGG